MNDLYKQAVEAFKAGDKKKARSLLEELIKSEPNNADALFGLSMCSDTFEQTKSFLERVLAINPNYPKARERLDKLTSEQIKSTVTIQPLEPVSFVKNDDAQTKLGEIEVNEIVKQYLQKAKEQELIKRGLYESKYLNLEEYKKLTEETKGKFYWDLDKKLYYEKIPFTVTDEEFSEILKVPPFIKPKIESKLPATFALIAGLIFLCGGIGGFFIAQQPYGFNLQLAVTVWIGAFLSGMTYIGFGFIIRLLVDIYNKL